MNLPETHPAKHPVEWLLVDPGQGFDQLMLPRLKKCRTIYIGPAVYQHRLESVWKGCDIQFFSLQRIKHITEEDVEAADQLLIEGMGIQTTQFRYHPIRQSKAFYAIRRKFQHFPGPIMFRPRHGHERAFPVFSEAMQRAVVMLRIGYLMMPPNFDFDSYDHLNIDMKVARKLADQQFAFQRYRPIKHK